MIAYNTTQLDHRQIQTQAAAALAKKIITEDEHRRIRETYPCNLYTPNIFIRIGLFLLTVLAVACGTGILLLVGGNSSLTGILLFAGALSYGALEFMVHRQRHYRSGVDDALLWIASILIIAGINFNGGDLNGIQQSLLVLGLAAWGFLRFADSLMALVAYGGLLSLLFNIAAEAGAAGRALIPFLVMALSVLLYFSFTRLHLKKSLQHYRTCLILLRTAALVSFYLAGNYYIVREMNAFISGQPGPVALTWLWWTLTALTPLFYTYQGIKKKDVIFLWTGLALVAAAVFTVRYYYHVLPAEAAMVIAGSLLIGLAWALIRYLHTPKDGFTSEAADDPHLLESLHLESLIVTETFKDVAPQPANPGVQFGGGSGGGGGAGGEF